MNLEVYSSVSISTEAGWNVEIQTKACPNCSFYFSGITLRWPNKVFVRALANAIQRAHKVATKQTCRRYSDHFICSMPALSVLFFFIIERSVLIVLVFYHKGVLEKVTMQRTHQFSAFSLLPKEPS